MLAARAGVDLRAEKGVQARVTLTSLCTPATKVALAVPTTYMNESGLAVRGLAKRYGIDDPTSIVVVHDELDLPPGTVRVKAGGGLAGHNGLRSLQAHLHSTDFVRVRIGVGKPPSAARGAAHVLESPPQGRPLAPRVVGGAGGGDGRAHRLRRCRRGHAMVPFPAFVSPRALTGQMGSPGAPVVWTG